MGSEESFQKGKYDMLILGYIFDSSDPSTVDEIIKGLKEFFSEDSMPSDSTIYRRTKKFKEKDLIEVESLVKKRGTYQNKWVITEKGEAKYKSWVSEEKISDIKDMLTFPIQAICKGCTEDNPNDCDFESKTACWNWALEQLQHFYFNRFGVEIGDSLLEDVAEYIEKEEGVYPSTIAKLVAIEDLRQLLEARRTDEMEEIWNLLKDQTLPEIALDDIVNHIKEILKGNPLTYEELENEINSFTEDRDGLILEKYYTAGMIDTLQYLEVIRKDDKGNYKLSS